MGDDDKLGLDVLGAAQRFKVANDPLIGREVQEKLRAAIATASAYFQAGISP